MNIICVIILAVAALLMTPLENVMAQVAKLDASSAKPDEAKNEQDAVNITITYDAFSLPIAKASELQRKGMTDTALYKELIKSSKLEKMLTIKTNSGQRARVENGSEYIHPTEFHSGSCLPPLNPPAPPRSAGTEPVPSNKRLPIPFTPTAFTNRLLGDSFEIDPVLDHDAKSVSMSIAVSHVRLTRRVKWGKGIEEREEPLFEKRSLKIIRATATHGMPVYIGTLSPVFGNGVADRKEQDVWLAFITVNLSHQMPVNPDNPKAKP